MSEDKGHAAGASKKSKKPTKPGGGGGGVAVVVVWLWWWWLWLTRTILVVVKSSTAIRGALLVSLFLVGVLGTAAYLAITNGASSTGIVECLLVGGCQS